jgi:hypothetical protein
MLLSLWHTSLVVIEVGGHPNFWGGMPIFEAKCFSNNVTIDLSAICNTNVFSEVFKK